MKTGWVGPLSTLLAGLVTLVVGALTGQDIAFWLGAGLALGGVFAIAGWALGKWEPPL